MKLPFDAIFILTCTASKDRLPGLLSHIDKIKFDVPVFTHFSANSKLLRFMSQKINCPKWIQNGYALPCACGHYFIAHDALDRGYEKVMILEDDIRFANDRDFLFRSFEMLPDNSDWALVDWWPWGDSELFKSGKLVSYMNDNMYARWVPWCSGFSLRSTGAYIASRKGLNAIIDIQDNSIPGQSPSNGRFYAADELWESEFADRYRLNCYVANPVLARQFNMKGHGGGLDLLYTRGHMTSPEFDLSKYTL